MFGAALVRCPIEYQIGTNAMMIAVTVQTSLCTGLLVIWKVLRHNTRLQPSMRGDRPPVEQTGHPRFSATRPINPDPMKYAAAGSISPMICLTRSCRTGSRYPLDQLLEKRREYEVKGAPMPIPIDPKIISVMNGGSVAAAAVSLQ